MKGIVWILILFCVCTTSGCFHRNTSGDVQTDSTFIFKHKPSNAVYYWKRSLNLSGYERDFIKNHDIKRVYLKFFDVGTDNLYNGQGEQPIPIATMIFNGSQQFFVDNEIEIVPVVFVTVEALRQGKPLSEKIVKRVDDMCKANHMEYKEIQLDCDWTRETKYLFFELCQEVKQQLHIKKKGLSATIRLHQLRDSLPDIDYGVLMLYNTESLQDPKVKNSILSSEAVKAYMKYAKSDKHLDFAFPTYDWTLWFKDGKFRGIVNSFDTLKEGTFRCERSEYEEIIATKNFLKSDLKDIDYASSTIIYHLDSTNLSKYSDDEINKIYSR